MAAPIPGAALIHSIMCCKSIKFTDHIVGCEDIRVNAVLASNTNYVWEINDHFGNVYMLAFTTDDSGIGTIDVSQLPDGFCNAAGLAFTLKLKQSIESCDYVDIPFIQKYEQVCVEQRSGNIPKSFIGCPYVVPNNSGFISGRKQFTGTDGQLSYQNNDLIDAVQIIVVNEKGVLQQGPDPDQYQFDKITGEIEFGQEISSQQITIIYFK